MMLLRDEYFVLGLQDAIEAVNASQATKAIGEVSAQRCVQLSTQSKVRTRMKSHGSSHSSLNAEYSKQW